MGKNYRIFFLVFISFMCILSVGCSRGRNSESLQDSNKISNQKKFPNQESKEEIYYDLKTSSPEKTSISEAVRTRDKNEKNQDELKKAEQKNKKKEKQEVVTENYFDDAVFIGDSRTEGFGIQSGLNHAAFYTDKGLMVDTIFKKTPVSIGGKKFTIIDAVKQNSFKKIYIMFGINELGWPYDTIFIERYGKVIDELKKAQPDATIYIQSIIHISKDKEKKSYMSNEKINRRNELIKQMAKEKKVEYINLNQVLTDKQGFLFKDASSDGVHLNRKYCQIWKKYLMKHTKG